MAKKIKISNKVDITVPVRIPVITTDKGEWANSVSYIRYPKGTKFNLVEETAKECKVELDYTDEDGGFILGFSICKSVFGR
jgi:hypothetical protein